MKLKVKLGTVNNAGIFTAKCNEYKDDIDYKCKRFLLDAKSLMGVLSMGLEHVCEVEIHTDDKGIEEKFREDMSLWIVEDKDVN